LAKNKEFQMNIRLMPPATGSTTTTVNGRTYTCALGSTIDVPDFDAYPLTANGWVATDLHGVGATTGRPANPIRGAQFFDSTLGFSIAFDGKTWRNKSTGAAV
jgi:hypothetical protein